MKIGDFSNLSRVSVKTLRFYDEVGLLKPAQTDPCSGYRLYSVDQMSRLNRILAFKDLGFSLEQIAHLIDENLPVDQMRGMLRMRQAEIQEQVQETQARLERVEARLRLIEQEDQMSTIEVVIKKVNAQSVVSLRDLAPSYDKQKVLWDELENFLMQHNVKPAGACLTIYHDPEYKEHDVDLEVCEPVNARLPEHPRIKAKQLSAIETAACAIHKGNYTGFGQTYTELMRWLEANRYRITGPIREVYLRSVDDTRNPDEFVTEIQVPVEKG